MKRILFFFALTLAALPACATDIASHHLLVPIAGRTAGAHGSQWKTDLVLTNAALQGEPQTVEIFLIVDGVLAQPVVALLQPRQTVILEDVIYRAFAKEQATGMILIAVREPRARLTARARIYNGGHGQTVPAMPLAKLSKEAFIPGLSGLNGNRSNAGIANPEAEPAAVFISIFNAEGEARGGFATEVAPFSVLQLNDVFSYFQTGPLEGATVQVRSSHGVYAFASIVRADSGDADFVIGTGTELDDAHVVIQPQCAGPATLSLAALPAKGWSVLFERGVDPYALTPELESRLGFKADRVYNFGAFFTEDLTAEKVAALRCEDSVRVVEQNGYVPVN